MRQIFLLILLFIVGQWLVKALRRHDAQTAQRTGAGANGANSGANAANNGAGSSNGQPQLAEPMIRCVECGVHAPQSDSVSVAGQTFCCAAHAQRHGARPSGRDAR
ncbi:deaminase [Paraburkholderia sp. Ac-20336]|uniref:PP0621 family protein n=1 Tax=Burkholderiaceae TaxID=119060 RepID=UPI0014207CDE|nr:MULTISPECIES: PP0621 family protein [Burkholderiaceae]MBN3803725.1 deaminase [Paraburkholderia sp. Ac-20336]MBN3849073.1 deaminase [Paraburkholderia sp. Ac-20342]NIF55775.1 deaminase [Burkholderia sp. Ax-1724]NIF80229.1 deaminase [Paraburkholderia sp. Cy-641]